MNQKIPVLLIGLLLFSMNGAAQEESFNVSYESYLDGQPTGNGEFMLGEVQPGDTGLWIINFRLSDVSNIYIRMNKTGDRENTCVEPETHFEGSPCTSDGELDENMQFTAWIDDNENQLKDDGEKELNIEDEWVKLVRDQSLTDYFKPNKTYNIAVRWKLKDNTTSIVQTDSVSYRIATAASETQIEEENDGAGETTTTDSGNNEDDTGGGFTLLGVNGENEDDESSSTSQTDSEDNQNQQPTADFSYRNLNETNRILFNASESEDPDGDIVEYRWDFEGLPETSTFYIKEYTFNTPGRKEVTLTTVDKEGGKTSITKTVTVVETSEPETVETDEEGNSTAPGSDSFLTGAFGAADPGILGVIFILVFIIPVLYKKVIEPRFLTAAN